MFLKIVALFCFMHHLKTIHLCYFFYFQIPHLRPTEYKRSRLARNRRTVNRAYGGVLSGSAVKERSVIFTLISRLLRFSFCPSDGLSFYWLVPQNHPSFFGRRAEDCEESFEDSEGQGKASRQELKNE